MNVDMYTQIVDMDIFLAYIPMKYEIFKHIYSLSKNI